MFSRATYFFVLVLLTVSCSSTPATRTKPAQAITTAEARPVAGASGPTRPAAADFERHVAELKKRLPSNGFTIVVQPPFVVIGDGPADQVKRRADDTVKWTVDKLKQDYFTEDPKEILDIWLFKDAESYTNNAQRFFNDTPTTPYGYYSSEHKALIMNIGTGGGTLVHEIVHPFMEANFPACPPWFNEGMGSLYEHVGEENGHIYGYVNWRLPRLQKAIKEGTVPSFETLMAMDAKTFYADRTGVHYAQSRYLCYYLQETKLLVKFYKWFYARQKTDPSGFATLAAILKESDMVRFQKDWEKFVLGLSYTP
jgi:hypothetical protein